MCSTEAANIIPYPTCASEITILKNYREICPDDLMATMYSMYLEHGIINNKELFHKRTSWIWDLGTVS